MSAPSIGIPIFQVSALLILSATPWESARLLVLGRSNAQIADRLVVSPKTVPSRRGGARQAHLSTAGRGGRGHQRGRRANPGNRPTSVGSPVRCGAGVLAAILPVRPPSRSVVSHRPSGTQAWRRCSSSAHEARRTRRCRRLLFRRLVRSPAVTCPRRRLR